jgi:hypothetical protein
MKQPNICVNISDFRFYFESRRKMLAGQPKDVFYALRVVKDFFDEKWAPGERNT